MSFNINYMNLDTAGQNTLAPVGFKYKSTGDTLATIVASGYFDDMIPDLTNGVGKLKIGDLIYCAGSDDTAFVSVTAVTTAVTVAKNVIDDSSIITGSISVGKLAVTEGNLIIGDSADDGAFLNISAGGSLAIGNDTTIVALDASGDTKIMVGNGTTITSVALSNDVTMDNAGAVTIAAAAVEKAMLAATVRPSHMIVFAGQPTTAGGAAAEAITVTGAVAATDYAFVEMVDDGTNNTTIVNAVVTTDTLTVTFSADPGADAVINYQLIRATS